MTKPVSRSRKPKLEWTLVCVTQKGSVSMLRDLDLYTARETYKRLRPYEYPREHIFPDCEECGRYGWSWSGGGATYSSNDDRLDKVEVIGPPGKNLDPWHGVEPAIIDMTHLCRCGNRKPPVPTWDETRKDFWNNPKLWDKIDDPKRQMCWMLT